MTILRWINLLYHTILFILIYREAIAWIKDLTKIRWQFPSVRKLCAVIFPHCFAHKNQIHKHARYH